LFGADFEQGCSRLWVDVILDLFESKFEIVQMSSLKHSKVIPDVIDCDERRLRDDRSLTRRLERLGLEVAMPIRRIQTEYSERPRSRVQEISKSDVFSWPAAGQKKYHFETLQFRENASKLSLFCTENS